jgi:hypothetical protein
MMEMTVVQRLRRVKVDKFPHVNHEALLYSEQR